MPMNYVDIEGLHFGMSGVWVLKIHNVVCLQHHDFKGPLSAFPTNSLTL